MNAGAGGQDGDMRVSVLLLLLAPIILVNLLAFILPVLNLATLSFRAASASGTLSDAWTLSTWQSLLTDTYYWRMVWRTVWIGLLITAITLVLSYPLALFVSRQSGMVRTVLVVVCISPLLISAVVRTYGWMVILGNQGFAPSIIRSLGFTPPRLINNTQSVVIGMVEILMPYMILCLLAGFGRLEKVLEEAASSLGATPFTTFRRVILPLSLPGVLLGCLLCFVLAVSSFITPKMLAGGRVSLLATEIYDQAVVTLNWPLAAGLSVMILVIFGLALVLYGRLSRALV